MIYLDNAATTFPKPPQVSRAVDEALRVYGANPGRSGHKQSMRSSKEIYDCRVKAAALFHAQKRSMWCLRSIAPTRSTLYSRGF